MPAARALAPRRLMPVKKILSRRFLGDQVLELVDDEDAPLQLLVGKSLLIVLADIGDLSGLQDLVPFLHQVDELLDGGQRFVDVVTNGAIKMRRDGGFEASADERDALGARARFERLGIIDADGKLMSTELPPAKTSSFPVTVFGVDAFNIDDRCAQIRGSYRAIPWQVRRAVAKECERFVQSASTPSPPSLPRANAQR